jgi:hypothetical protein
MDHPSSKAAINGNFNFAGPLFEKLIFFFWGRVFFPLIEIGRYGYARQEIGTRDGEGFYLCVNYIKDVRIRNLHTSLSTLATSRAQILLSPPGVNVS